MKLHMWLDKKALDKTTESDRMTDVAFDIVQPSSFISNLNLSFSQPTSDVSFQSTNKILKTITKFSTLKFINRLFWFGQILLISIQRDVLSSVSAKKFNLSVRWFKDKSE